MSTAVLPPDRVVARAFGGAVLRDCKKQGPASHDGDGIRYVFVPDDAGPMVRYALDVEKRGPAPQAVKAYLDGSDDDVLRRWTALEVLAKLLDMPSAVALKRLGDDRRLALDAFDCELDGLAIFVQRRDTPDAFVAVGRKILPTNT